MKKLVLLAVLAFGGVAAAVAVAAVTTSTSVSCATTQAALHTVGIDGSPVTTVGGDSLSVCATATATATDQTVTVTTTVPGPTTTVTAAVAAPLTYDQAISYTQTRPAFTPSREVDVTTAAQFSSALSNLQAGDLVKATAPFTVSGETIISKRLTSYAELDLSGVSFVYSGGSNFPAVWVKNAAYLYLYGGDMSTVDTGGQGILLDGSQHVLWWGFTIHDTGSTGLAARPTTAAADSNDFQGEIWKVGQNLSWDSHCTSGECGTGLHGANLYDSSTTYNFTNNRFALYAHDIPTGACVEFGDDNTTAQATGNVLYLKCVNETEVSTQQTGGNALQLWGYTANVGLDVKYLEGNNLQGYALYDGGVNSGQTCGGVTVEYGRASNTNLNSRFAGQSPWQSDKGVVYQDVLPAP